MTTENIADYRPFPEVPSAKEIDLKEEYQKLLQREAAQAEADLQSKLDNINSTGDISELLADNQLRFKFEQKFTWQRFTALRRQFDLKHAEQAAAAERAAKMSKFQLSTTQGRIAAANATRKAGAGN